jgi:GT2 family glycosyltransferase/glycosyltransferase involved in cell wall biosynthesis
MEQPSFPSIIISASSRRSGSTWLQRIIHASTDVFVWGESFPMVELLSTLYANFQRNQSVQAEETEQFLSTDQDPTSWMANINPPLSNLRTANIAFFSDYYKGSSKPRYGWKEVHYGRSELKFIRGIFPETKIILLVRNPIHVAESLSKLGWIGRYEDTQNLEMIAELWRERTRDYLSIRNDPGYLFIRYEDIHKRLGEILDFVGGKANETMEGALGTIVSGTDPASSLSAEDKNRIINICEQEMFDLGYLESRLEVKHNQDAAILTRNAAMVDGPTGLSSVDQYGAALAYKREALMAEQEITRLQSQLGEQEKSIISLKSHNANLNEIIADQDARINNLGDVISVHEAHVAALEAHIAILTGLIAEMRNTLLWKITKPLRFAGRFLRNPKDESYNLVRYLFRKLPGPLQSRLEAPAVWVVQKVKRTPGKIKSLHQDTTWEEFEAAVLSRKDQFKGVFIQEFTIDWGVPLYQRPQHLATALGQLGYLVIYRTFNVVDDVNGFREVAENVWLTNYQHLDRIPGAVHSIYSTAYVFDVHKLNRLLNRERFLVYEYIDHIDPMISGSDENVKRLLAMKEFAFNGGADLIVASSNKLRVEAVSAVGRDKVLYLPNGVDVDHYRNVLHETTPIPKNLAAFRNKYPIIVGYFGAIAPWLWYDAIGELARMRPDLGFVFIGPDYHSSVQNLPVTGNVLYLGTIEYKVLPAYARQFDVCFIPFAPGEIAHTTSPLKLFEYFALEKPVVTTSFMDECIAFPEVFHGNNVKALSGAIDRAIAVKEDPAYRARLARLARENSWKERAKLLEPVFVNNPVDSHHAVVIQPKLPQEEIDAILRTPTPLISMTEKKADIICFSIIDWDFRFQRPQQIMTQFAKHGHRVFYISISKFLPPGEAPGHPVRRIGKNIFEISLSAHQVPNIYGECLGEETVETLLGSLEELRLAYGIEEAIGYVMIASWTPLAMRTRKQWGWQVVYDCMDEWDNFPLITPAILQAELDLVEKCDLLVVTSRQLYNKWQKYNRPTVLARNGTDYEFYAERCLPNQILEKTDRPVIGYFGAIADWFDLELMLYIARNRPQYHFVLLGGVFDLDVSELQSLPNVSLLGQQPYETMPEYLYHFNVCTIPFKMNSITEATNPVKVYEYLSGGKPVVSVALPELKPYKELLYLANDPDDFLFKLDEAVSENDPEIVKRRKAFARENSWKSRYDQILTGIRQVTPRASIVIVTYNNLALTQLCLESILRNTAYPHYEVVIVDNNSSDGTQSYLHLMADSYDHMKVIYNAANRGFAAANNQGLEQAEGQYLVLLNNDTIVPIGWLSRLVYHLKDPKIGIVGSVTNAVENEARVQTNYRTFGEMETFAREFTWMNYRQIADIHMLAMYCVAFRRDVYKEIGPLDERFGIGMFEDDDYSLRIHKKGLRVVCALDVFVHHFGQASFGKLHEDGSYYRLFEENRRKYEQKWQLEWKQHQNVLLQPVYHDSNTSSLAPRSLMD